MKILVSGVAGKMGRKIVEAIANDDPAFVGTGLEHASSPFVGRSIADFTGIGGIDACVTADARVAVDGCDIAIDFTAPAATLALLKLLVAHNKPAVIGTTGLDSAALDTIGSYAKSIPIVLSPNMSIGINVMLKILELATEHLAAYDIEITEAHHNQKKDAPSGTAIAIAKTIAAKLGKAYPDDFNFGRTGQTGARPRGEIGMQVIRGGDIVGDHTVLFAGPGERIEIIHRATSRDNFARGAYRAARWLIGREPGLYTMSDVLGLR